MGCSESVPLSSAGSGKVRVAGGVPRRTGVWVALHTGSSDRVIATATKHVSPREAEVANDAGRKAARQAAMRKSAPLGVLNRSRTMHAQRCMENCTGLSRWDCYFPSPFRIGIQSRNSGPEWASTCADAVRCKFSSAHFGNLICFDVAYQSLVTFGKAWPVFSGVDLQLVALVRLRKS